MFQFFFTCTYGLGIYLDCVLSLYKNISSKRLSQPLTLLLTHYEVSSRPSRIGSMRHPLGVGCYDETNRCTMSRCSLKVAQSIVIFFDTCEVKLKSMSWWKENIETISGACRAILLCDKIACSQAVEKEPCVLRVAADCCGHRINGVRGMVVRRVWTEVRWVGVL